MSNALSNPCDEGVIRSTRAEAPCARRTGSWVLAATNLDLPRDARQQLEGEKLALASALGAALLIEAKKKPEEQPEDPETKVLAA